MCQVVKVIGAVSQNIPINDSSLEVGFSWVLFLSSFFLHVYKCM